MFRAIGNFVGLSYDMKIINDTAYDCTWEDPLGSRGTLESGYSTSWHITPSYAVKVNFRNPDGSSQYKAFVQSKKDTCFRLTDWIDKSRVGKATKVDWFLKPVYECHGGSHAYFTKNITTFSGSENTSKTTSSVQAQINGVLPGVTGEIKGSFESVVSNTTQRKEEIRETIEIDAGEPCYVYIAFGKVHFADGSVVSIGGHLVQSSEQMNFSKTCHF